MRVLAVTGLYPNPHQPHRASFNRRQLAALAAIQQVEVIAPIAWTKSLGPLPRGGTQPRITDGLTVHHPQFLYTPRVLRGWHGHFYLRSIRRCFQRVVRNFRPDAVLACWAYPDGWATARLAREAGLPIAIKVHGSDLLTLPEFGGPLSRRGRTIEALQSADAVIAVSRHLRDAALRLGASPSSVHTVYNGVDTARFSPGPRDAARQRLAITGNDPLILFVGNLVAVKGPDVLLSALALVKHTRTRFRSAVIGDGPLRRALSAQAQSLGLANYVRFVGAQAQDDLPDWYRAADLVVVPSRSEGIPNVLLEAAACGTPFIATCVGGIPEIASPAALVPPDDPRALSKRIRHVLSAPAQPTPAALQVARSWSDSATELASILHELVQRTRHTAKTG